MTRNRVMSDDVLTCIYLCGWAVTRYPPRTIAYDQHFAMSSIKQIATAQSIIISGATVLFFNLIKPAQLCLRCFWMPVVLFQLYHWIFNNFTHSFFMFVRNELVKHERNMWDLFIVNYILFFSSILLIHNMYIKWYY